MLWQKICVFPAVFSIFCSYCVCLVRVRSSSTINGKDKRNRLCRKKYHMRREGADAEGPTECVMSQQSTIRYPYLPHCSCYTAAHAVVHLVPFALSCHANSRHTNHVLATSCTFYRLSDVRAFSSYFIENKWMLSESTTFRSYSSLFLRHFSHLFSRCL